MNCTQPTIGSEATNDGFFNGDIAQVTVYNRALTGEEIWQNYKVTRHKFRAQDVKLPTPGSGGPTVPSVLTNDAVPDIYSAATGLQVLSVGSGPIIRQGILWSQTSGIISQVPNSAAITSWPETQKSLDITNPTSLTFDTTLQPLSNGSVFYYVAFAENSAGIGWGLEKTLTTLTPGKPTVNALSFSIISLTNIELTGQVVSINGAAVTRRGFVFSTSPITTLQQAASLDVPSSRVQQVGFPDIGLYTISVSSLTPGQSYYFESYAQNQYGTGYSLDGLVFTVPDVASISISLSSVTTNKIVISIISSGLNITNQGVFYSTTNPPDYNASLKTDIGTGQQTNALSELNGLTPGTTYFIRGYIINDPGQNLAFSINTLQVTTSNVPTVSMVSVDTVKDITTTVTGNLSVNGGSTVTQKGFVAATTQNPTLQTVGVKSISSANATLGNYQLTLATLVKNTTYYVRAYATNIHGTGYSTNQLNFLTLTDPVVTTVRTESLLTNSVTLVGSIASNLFGNDTTVTVGFEWLVLSIGTPTVVTVNTSFTGGQFTYNLTGLQAATQYQFRAFATNSAPLTDYGSVINFTTQGVPPTFSVALSSTGVQFQAVVTITNNGGTAIIQKGIVWSQLPNPTIALSTITQKGAGTSNFTDTITSGITHNVTYYVRAYVETYQNFYTTDQTIQIDTFPSLTLNAPTNVTNTSMSVSVTNVFNGRDTIIERGVVWSTSQNPTTTSFTGKSVNGFTDTSDFSASLGSLSAGTTYYIRAYAENSVGIAYSAQQTKATNNNVELITIPVTDISALGGILGGEVLNKGTRTIVARGIAYSSTDVNPFSPQDQVDTTDSIGEFSKSVTNLNPNTTYYVKAYARTSVSGTYYGPTVSFKTLSLNNPSVGIGTPTKSGLSFTVFVNISGDLITDRGLVWSPASVSTLPTIANNKVSPSPGSGALSTSITVNTGLLPSTTYYMRAFATNANGTFYFPVNSSESLTLSSLANVIHNTPPAAVAQTTATVNCQVNNDGGEVVTERGLIYKATTSTTNIVIGAGVLQEVDAGSGIGTFAIGLTGLVAGTTYQIRAYAVNAMGTAYSTQTSFNTLTVPVVIFTSQTNTDLGKVQVIADVTSNGGATLTERGVLYSTTVTNPTWATTLPAGVFKVSQTAGLNTGSYTTNLTGLNQNVLYYIRAYAVNNQGAGYATTQTITTWISPSITTNEATAITTTSVTINGTITSDGGSTITSRGFYFGTSNPPTNEIILTGTTGAYSSNRTGLASNTVYYFQAWCINAINPSNNRAKGAVISVVTTGSNLPIVISSSIVLNTDDTNLLAGDPIAYSIGPSIQAGSLGSYFFNMQASSSSGNLIEVGLVSKAGSQPDAGSFDNTTAFGSNINQTSITITRGKGNMLPNSTLLQYLRIYAQNASGHGYSPNYLYPMFSLSLKTAIFSKGIIVTVTRDVMLSGYSIASQGIAYQDTLPTSQLVSGDPYFNDGNTIYYNDTTSIGNPSVSIDWNNSGASNWIKITQGSPTNGNFAVRAYMDVQGPVFGASTIRFWSNKLNTNQSP
jgi:hypothetical protein